LGLLVLKHETFFDVYDSLEHNEFVAILALNLIEGGSQFLQGWEQPHKHLEPLEIGAVPFAHVEVEVVKLQALL
jgi:hypothetical protein